MTNSAYAKAPFDHAKADIILRSSDCIDFRVFRLFLSLASPFFEALFDIPQPVEESGDQEIKDGLAVIPVTENSKTLDVLLRFCYPCTLVDNPNIDSEVLNDVIDVLEAARKYSLDVIEKKACQAIANPEILEEEPLRCFAIAHRGGLREETILAARYTLSQPLIPEWFQEINLLSATDLLTLLTYHEECGDAAYELRLDLSWITSHYESPEACFWLSGRCRCDYFGIHIDDCPRPASTGTYKPFGRHAPRWWEDFMEGIFTELRDNPCKETVEDFAAQTVKDVKAKGCAACFSTITEGMREFSDLLVKEVEEAVSQVSCAPHDDSLQGLILFLGRLS